MSEEAVVTFFLHKLEQVLTYYVDLSVNAKYELGQLRDELNLLRSFLQEVGKMRRKTEPLKEMEMQIRRAVHKVEDIVDSCLTHKIAERHKNRLKKAIGVRNRVRLAEMVKEAREKNVKPVLARAQAFNLTTEMAAAGNFAADQTRDLGDMLIREDNVVGFEDEENTIIGYLKEVKDKIDVVSIIGMPGLGKTTLAWKIFNNKYIQFNFPIRIWVNISKEFNRREILLKIGKAFTQQDCRHLADDDLILEVRNNLKNAGFLLVLDDVWDDETWHAIKPLLLGSNPMAKVLITSRETKVDARINHKLRFLSPDESWQLLQYEVFQGLGKCPDQKLESIGRGIAHQCDGLPLGLVVMGGILLDYYNVNNLAKTIDEWESISHNVSSHIRNDDKLQRVQKMVELSYSKLPDEERDCFVYVGVFPEDYEIPTRLLILLWIAEGFIQRKQDRSLEETGAVILMDLINRNLLMVEKTNYMGHVKKCRVHDVIREFCKSKAGIEELNLFQEIKTSKDGGFYPPVSNIHEYRRLCIHSELSRFLKETFNESQGARSFLYFNDERMDLPKNQIATIPDKFKLLRVLDSKSFKFHIFPIKVTNLIHLRYITLCCPELDSLPEQISNLWNLQTLLVDTKSPTLKIKANIWKMFELRHLKTTAAIHVLVERPEKGKVAGENLQSLNRLSTLYCSQDLFDTTCNLNRLGIRGDISLLMNAEYSLEKMKFLEKLKLYNDRFHEASHQNPRGPPKLSFFPHNIKRLTLSATFLEWKHMSTLAEIPTLNVLKLKDNAFTGDKWTADGNGFPNLRFLLIAVAPLVLWEVSNGHFPVLNCLILRNCENLKEIPLDLTKSLQKVDVDQVPKSALKNIEELEGRKIELLVGLKCM